MQKTEPLLTVGEIARLTCQPIHRIEYLIRSRNIQARQRAGNSRIFSADDLALIETELKRISDRKGARWRYNQKRWIEN